MFSTKAELPQKTVLQIQQDDKFFSRLLSKESSMSKPSFRMAVAVPFVWESQPGTPKYTFSDNTLPPLTPPPSYYVTSITKNKPQKKRSKFNVLLTLIPKLNLKKINILSPSPSSLSSTSASLWSHSDNNSSKAGRRRFLSFGSSFDFRGEDEEEDGAETSSPTSSLHCFGISRSTSTLASSGFRGSSRR